MTPPMVWTLLPILSLSLLFLLTVLVYPIVSIVHCLRNPNLTTAGKVIWALLILFTWPLGAALYGVFSSMRSSFKLVGF